MSAILLRELLTHGTDSHSDAAFWPRLEPDDSTAKKVADTISALAVSLLLLDSTLPDLLPFLFSTFDASHTHPHLQEYALLIFSNIANVPSVVGSHLTTLKTLLLVGLSLYKCSLGCTIYGDQPSSTTQEALKLLVELAGAKAGFVAYQKFGGAIIFMLQIDTRRILLDLEDDPAWYTVVGRPIVLVTSELIQTFLHASEWKKRYAALITFAQTAEMMSQSLKQVVNMLLPSFQVPHARVRWAAIEAMSQFSTYLRPDMQAKYYQMVLPALELVMNDFQNPVWAKVMRAA
ncbi:hypothetical protein ZIOFF_027219 [Zingiber officinale]|uniref:Uncharacterized protein n=1 Tax=Zingiber officinale TaxID=94328 RepID=A0A8J5GYH3_ZINOF|nr:hypothetical protein ZIOFF_027219 [Zingiber officinale]